MRSTIGGDVMAEMTSESSLADAHRVLQVDYNQDVAGWVEEVQRMVEQDDYEEGDALHELVDSLHRVIYTREAIEVLRYCSSDAENAYVQDFGTDGLVTDGAINWSALAYAAIYRDIAERLS